MADSNKPEPKKHSFEAEVAQLLHLVTHSLYSNADIFVRELVSNASDACDKLRFEGNQNDALYEGDSELRIRIDIDKDAKTISFIDNGIGMNEADAVEHLGTIAKSGTKAFLEKLSDAQKQDGNLIGQFGVGFYSGFIVADTITVESRKAGEPASQGVRWVSDGTGEFTTETIEKPTRGTTVILHVTDEHSEYLDRQKIKSLVNKYSDHISLPIQMRKEVWQEEELTDAQKTANSEAAGETAKGEMPKGQMITTDEWETINQGSALWARPRADVTDDQYIAFYQHIAHENGKPLGGWTQKVKTSGLHLLYIGQDRNVWTFDRAMQKMLKYDQEGHLLYAWGSMGMGAGYLWGVHGMHVDQEGNLYVAEVDSGRVQKFVPRPGANPTFLVAKPVKAVWQ